MKYDNIIFLDIDGVLNCELFYKKQIKEAKKDLRKQVKSKEIQQLDYYRSQICTERISLLNKLCADTNACIVVSSTWRLGKTVEQLQQIFDYCGATFHVLDKTKHTGYERGTEISKWLKENVTEVEYGVNYYDFRNYAIIDDDSDMLLNQAQHFFHTDTYSGLTHNTCYRIKRFLTGKTF